MTSPEWEYFSFYFGNASWPSEAVWRESRETGERQLLIMASTGRRTVDELRAIWEDARSDHTVDPHYTSWTVRAHGWDESYELHALRYWMKFDDEAEARETWAMHEKWDGMGAAPMKNLRDFTVLNEE